jgi:hypothetical protein
MSVLKPEPNQSARARDSDSMGKGQNVIHPENEHVEETEDTYYEDDPRVGATLPKAFLQATDF